MSAAGTQPTPIEAAARWMLDQVRKKKWLYQTDAVWDVERKFGKTCVRENASGNTVFATEVLREFRKISEKEVVWDPRERVWRLRGKGDLPGRKQE